MILGVLILLIVVLLVVVGWLGFETMRRYKSALSCSKESFSGAKGSGGSDSSTALLYTVIHKGGEEAYVASRTWKNTAPPPTVAASVKAGCADGDRGIEFSEKPAFEEGKGILMSNVTATGPLSHVLDIDLDRAFSIALVYHDRSRGTDDSGPGTILQIFANTPNNNGLHLYRDSSGLYMQLGAQEAITLEEQAEGKSQYVLLVITRDSSSGKIRAVAIDLEVADYVARQTELATANISGAARTPLSNKAMVINPSRSWNVALMELRITREYMSNHAIQAYAEDVRKYLELFDPDKSKVLDLTREVADLRKCPYNDETCAVCGGVNDWSDESVPALTGGKQCLSAINRFCSSNPSHAKCKCWDATNSEYDAACRAYRTIYDPSHAPPAPKCPKPAPPPPKPTPPPEEPKPPVPPPSDDDGDSDDDDDDDDDDEKCSDDDGGDKTYKHSHKHDHKQKKDSSFWKWLFQ